MLLRVALTGVLCTAVLASCPVAGAATAKADDPAAIAGDAAAFNKLRADIARHNAAQDPVQAKHKLADGRCKIKPVMTDAEIDACRHR